MFNEPCPEFRQPTSPVASSTDHNFGSVVVRQCSDDGNHFLANVSFPPLHHAQQHHHVMPMEQHEESPGSHHDFSSPKSTATVSNDDDMPLPPFVVCRVDDDQNSDNLGNSNLVDIRSPHSNSIGSGDSCGFFLSSFIEDGSGDAPGSKTNTYTMPVSSSLFECPSSPAQQQYNATSMNNNNTSPFSPKATTTAAAAAASSNVNTAVAASGGVISGLSSNAFTANIATMNEVFYDDMFPDPGLVTFVEMRVSGHPSP